MWILGLKGLTNDTQSSINRHFIMSIYAVCFSVIKSCTYWDSSTLQALHEHACLFYEKCNVDRVGKMPSNNNISVQHSMHTERVAIVLALFWPCSTGLTNF